MRITFPALALLVAGCAQGGGTPPPSGGTDPVSDAYIRSAITWTNGEKQPIAMRFKNDDDRFTVCGAWSMPAGASPIQQEASSLSMRDTSVYYDGAALFPNIAFFNQVFEIKDGATANCRISDVAIPEDFDPAKLDVKSTSGPYWLRG